VRKTPRYFGDDSLVLNGNPVTVSTATSVSGFKVNRFCGDGKYLKGNPTGPICKVYSTISPPLFYFCIFSWSNNLTKKKTSKKKKLWVPKILIITLIIAAG
jgi:hypothetical protein